MKINNNFAITSTNNRPNFKRNWIEHASWGAKFVQETGKTNFKLFTFPDAKAVFVEVAKKANREFGNIKDRIIQILATQGAAFTISKIFTQDDESQIYPMHNKGEGIFEAENINAEENAKYRYIIVKNNNEINLVKDPYAKKQADINGWSEIYNPNNYEWKATDWFAGKDPRRITRKQNEQLRGLENLIIEEINIPTLSKEGTFEKAKAHIDRIAEKELATAIEIMPVENCFSLQWGYDGVDKFAINEKMGNAAQLKELIDYAHLKGLNVIMDIVPNHIGPDGNYLTQAGPYIKGAGKFGDIPNYEGKDNKYVRDWMANVALWWADEFKVDGLRLDMTKCCESDYLLKQIIAEVNEHFPNVFMIAEDGRDNKHTVTDYERYENSHENELAMIDQSVDNIANKRWHTYPNAIGFDSEWDFPLMHELKNAIIEPYKINLDRLDSTIWNSKYRVKYVMSHDEIGNLDGTRLIPKVLANELNIFNRVSGANDAEKGQKAAHVGQKLARFCLENYKTYFNFKNLSDEENKTLQEKLKEMGIENLKGLSADKIAEAFETAYAKQKLAIATIMTIPGPKMYFQGDDELNLSYFKFFREFSNDKQKRAKDPNFIQNIINEKGYDTLESIARKDSLLDNIELQENNNRCIKSYTTFIRKILDSLRFNPVLTKGDIINTYKDHTNKIHIHHLKLNDDEALVIKNFGTKFFENFGYPNFPNGNWQESFNSDASWFKGSSYINVSRDITQQNQNLRLAPNSVVILKKV